MGLGVKALKFLVTNNTKGKNMRKIKIIIYSLIFLFCGINLNAMRESGPVDTAEARENDYNELYGEIERFVNEQPVDVMLFKSDNYKRVSVENNQLFWCLCPNATERMRIHFMTKLILKIKKKYTDKNTPITYIDIASGGLSQTYLTLLYLIKEEGYKKFNLVLIDYLYDKTLFRKEIERPTFELFDNYFYADEASQKEILTSFIQKNPLNLQENQSEMVLRYVDYMREMEKLFNEKHPVRIETLQEKEIRESAYIAEHGNLDGFKSIPPIYGESLGEKIINNFKNLLIEKGVIIEDKAVRVSNESSDSVVYIQTIFGEIDIDDFSYAKFVQRLVSMIMIRMKSNNVITTMVDYGNAESLDRFFETVIDFANNINANNIIYGRMGDGGEICGNIMDN